MTGLTIGAVRETRPGERRVALVPEAVGRLRALGADVLVETGAGAEAYFSDDAYTAAGATVVPAAELRRRAGVLLCVGPPENVPDAGRTLIGLLGAREDAALMARYAEAGVTAISLDLLPRTLSRAQAMDALTSQASVAGYKAVLVAAAAYGRYLPMLVTAAGTARPAEVLVLGAGVAGLQAIGTARRLGAQVTGYDVRPEARDDIRSLGARVLDDGAGSGNAPTGPDGAAEATGTAGTPAATNANGAGGYARELTGEERAAQQRALDERIARFDIVITTAQVPGRRPPLLVTGAAIEAMRPGSVIVDLAAGPLGGNVEGSEPGRTTVAGGGVTIIGADNLPATVPAAASTAYARNLAALLGVLVQDGELRVDLDDEVQAAVVVTHGGRIVNPAIESPVPTGGVS